MGGPYFLIDFENVQPKALERLAPGASKVKVFLGQNQNKLMLELVRALQPFGTDAEYIQIQGSGPDAVDFHIAFYIGEIAATQPGSSFRIISKDKGFDPLVRHLAQRGFDIERMPEIPVTAPPAPVVKTPVRRVAAPATKAVPATAVTTTAVPGTATSA